TFIYLTANGIVQGIRPIVGYNYGAGEYGRVHQTYCTALALTAAVMAVGTVICTAAAGPLIGLFTQSPETLALGKTALRIISLGFVVSSLSVSLTGVLEGLGRGSLSLGISLMRYLVVIVPLAWVLSRFFGAAGVWHAFWISEAITAAAAWLLYRKKVKGGILAQPL
ncbi:MAG: MATE family efflux transporter, partial [Oscillospiraceae bacterium]|nr:MATE family efflux transporter [Oscillospiraceae bacterium]